MFIWQCISLNALQFLGSFPVFLEMMHACAASSNVSNPLGNLRLQCTQNSQGCERPQLAALALDAFLTLGHNRSMYKI